MDYIRSECLRWICDNNFSRVVIQFKRRDLNNSLKVVNYLTKDRKQNESKPLEIFVAQSNTCCVDLLVTQHVADIDGIIHVGNVCISKPEVKCNEVHKPVLFVFDKPEIESDQVKTNLEIILSQIKSIKEKKPSSRICILYDTNLIGYATGLESIIQCTDLSEYVEIANLHCPLPNWFTTPDFDHKFVKSDALDTQKLGHFLLQRPLDQYNCAVYLGQHLSVQISLKGPSDLWKITIDEDNRIIKEKVNLTRLLNRRMALVGRLKDEVELKIGVIITNPLPDVGNCMAELENYAGIRKHILYYISMIQTTDEYKIGNFDLCDAFVIINSCSCSTILESLVFNRPILTVLEFKLACGFEAEYGRVLWPGSSSHLSEEDLINRRKVSDVSLALAHTRNELLERCSLARLNKWSGLEYSKGSGDGEVGESLDIEEGLTGIASSYVSEPLEKTEHE